MKYAPGLWHIILVLVLLITLTRATEGLSLEPIVLGAEDVDELDEVYITAGLKGHAGGLALEREPRKRGLKRRGRGTWDGDRLPVFGLLCRGGEARLFVLATCKPAPSAPLWNRWF